MQMDLFKSAAALFRVDKQKSTGRRSMHLRCEIHLLPSICPLFLTAKSVYCVTVLTRASVSPTPRNVMESCPPN